jgi:hypothetical protein
MKIDPDRSAVIVETVREKCTCFGLRRLTRLVTQRYDEALSPAGVRITQFTILGILHSPGPLSISGLAEELDTDRTTLTRNLQVLEDLGYVAVKPGPDARTRAVAIRRAGDVRSIRHCRCGSRRKASCRHCWAIRASIACHIHWFLYTEDPEGIPGKYRDGKLAEIRRAQSSSKERRGETRVWSLSRRSVTRGRWKCPWNTRRAALRWPELRPMSPTFRSMRPRTRTSFAGTARTRSSTSYAAIPWASISCRRRAEGAGRTPRRLRR